MFTANGPDVVAGARGGGREVSAEQLGSIEQPTLLVAGRDSPSGFAEATNLMARAIPSARVEWIEGGHLINPRPPAVRGFIDDVLAQRYTRLAWGCGDWTSPPSSLPQLSRIRAPSAIGGSTPASSGR
jgi:pimeloyl-ACP methyl ester carboxylesterase